MHFSNFLIMKFPLILICILFLSKVDLSPSLLLRSLGKGWLSRGIMISRNSRTEPNEYLFNHIQESHQGDGALEFQKSLAAKAKQFYDPRYTLSNDREKCILLAVEVTRPPQQNASFTTEESLSELSELVGTAGLVVDGCLIQRLPSVHPQTYIGTGKIKDLCQLLNTTKVQTIVVDDDLTSKQQRNLEEELEKAGLNQVKLLDRTAIILEIFAQHANSKEGQLQVELAMLEYRLTRGPKSRGVENDQGCGFRGPGESKIETDRRVMKDKIYVMKKEIEILSQQRNQSRKSRERLEIPVVALVGYTNAGKSTLMNQLSNAGVFAENMLFATLDPTTRKITLPKKSKQASSTAASKDVEGRGESTDLAKGQEIFLSDTVGFISKLPTNLIAAFRATLEEAKFADILVIVCDRSSNVWEKQRQTVYKELAALQCDHLHKPVIELWNKVDLLPTDTQNIEDVSVLEGKPLSLEEEIKLTIEERKKQQQLQQVQHPFAVVSASAKTGEGMKELIQTIEEIIEETLQQSITILIPYQDSQHQYLLNQIHLQGKIHNIEHLDEGSRIVCSLPPRLYDRVKSYQQK